MAWSPASSEGARIGGFTADMLRIWRSIRLESIVIDAGVKSSHLESVSDLNSFESLVNICAANHSQELNIAALSRTTGVASLTAKKWIGLLESCYLLYLLRPFHSNLGKRIVKSAKLYFMDSALAGYLTRQPSAEGMLAGSMGESFFEGFIVAEAVK